jgi:ABC-type lipoprotein release transport system permease subunit
MRAAPIAAIACALAGCDRGEAAPAPAGASCGDLAGAIARATQQGIEAELEVEVNAVNGHVFVLRSAGPHPAQEVPGEFDVASTVPAAAAIDPDVIAVEAFAMGDATGRHDGREVKLTVKGVEPQRFARVLGVSSHVVEGTARLDGAPAPIWLGVEAARTLGVTIGDDVEVVAPGGAATRTFRVTALHHYAMLREPYDRELAIVTLDGARAVLDAHEAAVGIELAVRDPARAADIAAALGRRLGPGYVAMGWRELNKPMLDAVEAARQPTVTTMTLALIGASSIWCRR